MARFEPTLLCTHFLEGKCRFMPSCKKLHPTDEKQAYDEYKSKGTNHLCFIKTDHDEAKCPYLHILPNNPIEATLDLNEMIVPFSESYKNRVRVLIGSMQTPTTLKNMSPEQMAEYRTLIVARSNIKIVEHDDIEFRISYARYLLQEVRANRKLGDKAVAALREQLDDLTDLLKAL